jgi:hypothetical protein
MRADTQTTRLPVCLEGAGTAVAGASATHQASAARSVRARAAGTLAQVNFPDATPPRSSGNSSVASDHSVAARETGEAGRWRRQTGRCLVTCWSRWRWSVHHPCSSQPSRSWARALRRRHWRRLAAPCRARRLRRADDRVILRGVVCKEPLGPRCAGGEQWAAIVKWTAFAMINAEDSAYPRRRSTEPSSRASRKPNGRSAPQGISANRRG